MLRCADQRYYTGHTDNLERRIAEHQSGAFKGYTYERRPVELVWSQDFQTREQAKEAETRIKKWSRDKKEALIDGEWEALSRAAIPPSERAERVSASLDPVPRLRSGQSGVGLENGGPINPVHPERSRRTGSSEAEMPLISPPPAIVLVRPQLGENIGKAARAMLNFGLTDMRIVAPRDGWPNADALPAASGADSVLDEAQVFATTAEAVADCAHVYATTVRKRGIAKPVMTPAETATAIHTNPAASAILFGPERSGLNAEDIALSRAIVTVPVNPDFSSLNLAQAVIILAYQWSLSSDLPLPTEGEIVAAAPQRELEGLISHFDDALEPTGYFFPPDRSPSTKRTLRSILTKPGWTSQEIRALRGVISALQKTR